MSASKASLEVRLVNPETEVVFGSWRVERTTPTAVDDRIEAIYEELDDQVVELFFGD
jgi:hypothetical protein